MEDLIKNLQRIIAEYPFPKVHRIIICFVEAMLQLRQTPDFISEVVSFTAFIREQLIRATRAGGPKIQGQISAELIGIIQSIMTFPDLADQEAQEICQFCQNVAPSDGPGLDKFLGKLFQCDFGPPRFPNFPQNRHLAVQAAMLKILASLHDETFILRPSKRLSTDEILTAITSFFKEAGFSPFSRREQAVSMEGADGKLLSVCVSNFGHEVRISVQ